MTTNQTLAIDQPRTVKPAAPPAARLFYAGAAVLLVLLMFLGFQRFYLQGRAYPGRPLTPPIRTLLIIHGTVMSTWMLLFLIQPLLIVSRRYRLHMMLGRIGAVLAACVLLLGFRLGIESARFGPPDLKIWGLSPRQFMIVPVVSILIFAAFVAAGLWNRRRPAIHRPMMLLAVLTVMPAAVSRIDFLNNLYTGTICETIFGPFFMTLVVGVLLVIVNWLMTRRLDRWLAIGNGALIVTSALIVQAATTSAWSNIAGLLLR